MSATSSGIQGRPATLEEQRLMGFDVPLTPAESLAQEMGLSVSEVQVPEPLMGPPAPPIAQGPSLVDQLVDFVTTPGVDVEGGRRVAALQAREKPLGRPAFTTEQKRKANLSLQFSMPRLRAESILFARPRMKTSEPEFVPPGFGAALATPGTAVELSMQAMAARQPVPPIAEDVSRTTMIDAIIGARLLQDRDQMRRIDFGGQIPESFERGIRNTLDSLTDLDLQQRFEREMASASIAENTRMGRPEEIVRSGLELLDDLTGGTITAASVEQFGQHFADAFTARGSDLVLESLELEQVDNIFTLYRQGRYSELLGAVLGSGSGFIGGVPGRTMMFIGQELARKGVPKILRGAIEFGALGLVDAPAIAERARREGRSPEEVAQEVGTAVIGGFAIGLGLSATAALVAGAVRVSARGATGGIRHVGQLYERSVRGMQDVIDRAPQMLDDFLPALERMGNVGRDMADAVSRGTERRRLFAIARAMGESDPAQFIRKELGGGISSATTADMKAAADRLQPRVPVARRVTAAGEFLREEVGGIRKVPVRTKQKIEAEVEELTILEGERWGISDSELFRASEQDGGEIITTAVVGPGAQAEMEAFLGRAPSKHARMLKQHFGVASADEAKVLGQTAEDLASNLGIDISEYLSRVEQNLIALSKEGRRQKFIEVAMSGEDLLGGPVAPEELRLAQELFATTTGEAAATNAAKAAMRRGRETVPVAELKVGEKFKIVGEEKTVTSIDSETGRALVEDGASFVVEQFGAVVIDKGTRRPVGGFISDLKEALAAREPQFVPTEGQGLLGLPGQAPLKVSLGAGIGKPPIKPPGAIPDVPPPSGPPPQSAFAREMAARVEFLIQEPIPTGRAGVGEPSTLATNGAYRAMAAQPFRTIEKLAKEEGAAYVQAFNQFKDITRANSGPFQERLLRISLSMSPADVKLAARIAGGRAVLPQGRKRTAIQRMVRELETLNDDAMQFVESQGVLKQDGTLFSRLKGGYFPQPLQDKFLRGIERWADEGLKRTSTVGMRPASRRQWKNYNTAVDAVAENMRIRRVRYDSGNKAVFPAREGDKVTDAVRRREAQEWIRDHRGRLTGEFRRMQEFGGGDTGLSVIPEGSVMLHRDMVWPEEMIRPDPIMNLSRHYHRVVGEKVAEARVFGPKNERLNALHKAAVRRANEDGNGEIVDALIRETFARDVRAPAARHVYGIDVSEKGSERLANLIRGVAAKIALMPGSTFASGSNIIWAVSGAMARTPVLKVPGKFGIADMLAGTGIGAATGFATAPVGATSEERRVRAIRFALAGAGIGAAKSVVQGQVSRRFLAAVPFIGPIARTSRRFERFTIEPILPSVKRGSLQGRGIEQIYSTNELVDAMNRTGVSQVFKDFFTASVRIIEDTVRAGSGNAVMAVAQKMQQSLVAAAGRNELGKFLASREGQTVVRWLGRVGIGRDTAVKLARKGELLNGTLMDRVHRIGVDSTQYRVDAMNTPIMWSSPWGKVATIFWGMHYRMFVNTMGVAIEEAGHRNFMPLVKVLPILIGAGFAVNELADFVTGRDLTPLMDRKIRRFFGVFGELFGPLGDRATAMFQRDLPAGQATREAFTPAPLGMAERVFNIGGQELRQLVGLADLPLGDERGFVEKSLRILPIVRFSQSLKERGTLERIGKQLGVSEKFLEYLAPSDKAIRRQLRAQMRRELTEELDVVESGNVVERFLRAGATRAQVPSISAEKSGVEANLKRLDRQVLASEAFDPIVERNLEIGRGPGTRPEVVGQEIRAARSAVLLPIVDDMQRALMANDLDTFDNELDRYFRGNGMARNLLRSLQTRARNPSIDNFFTQIQGKTEEIYRRELDVREFTEVEAIRRLRQATFILGQNIKLRPGREDEALALQGYLVERYNMSSDAIFREVFRDNVQDRLDSAVESVPGRVRRQLERARQPNL